MAETNPDAEKQQIMNKLLKRAMNDLYKAVDEAYPPDTNIEVINYYKSLLGQEVDENVCLPAGIESDACYGVNGDIVPTDVLVKALHQRVDILGVSAKQATDVLSESMNREVLLEVLYHLDNVMKAHGIRKRNIIKIVEKPVQGGEVYEDTLTDEGVSLPFANLKRDVNYGVLYERLVSGGYLEDTGKAGFLYYYTGEGEPPVEKLKWKAEGKILSMLMRELSNTGKVPWKEMNAVFEGLNTDSMKSTLAQSKNNKGDNLQYEQLIKELLS